MKIKIFSHQLRPFVLMFAVVVLADGANAQNEFGSGAGNGTMWGDDNTANATVRSLTIRAALGILGEHTDAPGPALTYCGRCSRKNWLPGAVLVKVIHNVVPLV